MKLVDNDNHNDTELGGGLEGLSNLNGAGKAQDQVELRERLALVDTLGLPEAEATRLKIELLRAAAGVNGSTTPESKPTAESEGFAAELGVGAQAPAVQVDGFEAEFAAFDREALPQDAEAEVEVVSADWGKRVYKGVELDGGSITIKRFGVSAAGERTFDLFIKPADGLISSERASQTIYRLKELTAYAGIEMSGSKDATMKQLVGKRFVVAFQKGFINRIVRFVG